MTLSFIAFLACFFSEVVAMVASTRKSGWWRRYLHDGVATSATAFVVYLFLGILLPVLLDAKYELGRYMMLYILTSNGGALVSEIMQLACAVSEHKDEKTDVVQELIKYKRMMDERCEEYMEHFAAKFGELVEKLEAKKKADIIYTFTVNKRERLATTILLLLSMYLATKAFATHNADIVIANTIASMITKGLHFFVDWQKMMATCFPRAPKSVQSDPSVEVNEGVGVVAREPADEGTLCKQLRDSGEEETVRGREMKSSVVYPRNVKVEETTTCTAASVHSGVVDEMSEGTDDAAMGDGQDEEGCHGHDREEATRVAVVEIPAGERTAEEEDEEGGHWQLEIKDGSDGEDEVSKGIGNVAINPTEGVNDEGCDGREYTAKEHVIVVDRSVNVE